MCIMNVISLGSPQRPQCKTHTSVLFWIWIFFLNSSQREWLLTFCRKIHISRVEPGPQHERSITLCRVEHMHVSTLKICKRQTIPRLAWTSTFERQTKTSHPNTDICAKKNDRSHWLKRTRCSTNDRQAGWQRTHIIARNQQKKSSICSPSTSKKSPHPYPRSCHCDNISFGQSFGRSSEETK